MELSWDEIEKLWKKHGGYVRDPRDRRDGKYEIKGPGLRDFVEELLDIQSGISGPDGIDVDDVAALYKRLQDLEERGHFVSQDVLDSALFAVEKALEKKLDRPDAEFVLGTWKCEGESPTGDCIYDLADEELNGEDECIFCGQPNERK